MNWFKRNKAKEEQRKERHSKEEQSNADFVNVLDFDSQTVTRIPARELAAHMVEARVDGIEGTVWVDARELRQSEYRHPPFSEELRNTLREIKSSVDEFYRLSLDEWEDGFRRDAHPEKEIGYLTCTR